MLGGREMRGGRESYGQRGGGGEGKERARERESRRESFCCVDVGLNVFAYVSVCKQVNKC